MSRRASRFLCLIVGLHNRQLCGIAESKQITGRIMHKMDSAMVWIPGWIQQLNWNSCAHGFRWIMQIRQRQHPERGWQDSWICPDRDYTSRGKRDLRHSIPRFESSIGRLPASQNYEGECRPTVGRHHFRRFAYYLSGCGLLCMHFKLQLPMDRRIVYRAKRSRRLDSGVP
jgi:hypothetical protein